MGFHVRLGECKLTGAAKLGQGQESAGSSPELPAAVQLCSREEAPMPTKLCTVLYMGFRLGV